MDRVYLDTSVFGGYFEPEFELWTKLLFDKIKKGENENALLTNDGNRIMNAPKHIMYFASTIPDKNIEFLSITNEATELAQMYINENVVGKTSRADCIHIAITTLNNADLLASWNFKHIVNISRIRGYNSINYKLGHKILEIRTPREIIEI